ncbi:MAG: nicotinamide-nucleotide adenylyltransferase [Candidatus Altiarchaeota archaeon]|nr:nicotinamide-nucleotide adenylyltransferase [Candidatus Altiarchaeota archaeon]
MRALIIGRFQPFHLGHLRLIEFAAREADSIIIGIGSSQESNTRENPFSAAERRRMIESSLAEITFEIFEIPDINNNEIWVSHVKEIIPEFDSVYTNAELERHLFKEAGCKVRETPFFDRGNYSGTEIRRRILAGEVWEDLVPEGTLKVMEEIKGEARIRELG